MKNILELNDLLAVDDSLALAPKNYLVILAYFIGCAASFGGAFYLKDIDSAFYSLSLIGVACLTMGIIKLFTPSKAVKDTTTHKRLKKYSFYYDPKNEREIIQLINDGNLDELKKLDKTAGQLLTVVYASSNREYYLAQAFKFVPHVYEPCIDPVIIKK